MDSEFDFAGDVVYRHYEGLKEVFVTGRENGERKLVSGEVQDNLVFDGDEVR